MNLFYTIKEQVDYSLAQRKAGKTIGIVPTMGALHEGHISLVERAVRENDIVVVSIFVNPIQFNNPEDLEKYPRDVDKDLELLTKANVSAVFIPSVKEMYPEAVKETYDFGALSMVMEGAFRPGHFNGVAVVVNRLFNIVMPNKAYFGEKDYQQLLVIKSLVKQHNLPIEIISCPISREDDGLARSSRNARLSPQMREAAPFIYQQLKEARATAKTHTVDTLEKQVINSFGDHPLLRLEYFKIADAQTLEPVNGIVNNKFHGFISVYAGDVRLIDNIDFI